jgi:dihydropyrimidinase
MALIIRNGSVVTEKGTIKADILIENEKISRIESFIPGGLNDEVINAEGKIVIPGAIDAHVHYHMKTQVGRTIDNYETGTLSAAFGGVTSFIDYATPIEGMSLLESLKQREKEAQGHSYLDYNFHMEITGEFEQDLNELSDLKNYGIESLKIYTTYGSTQLSDIKIQHLLKKAKDANMLVTVHAEDDEIVNNTKERFLREGKTAPCYHAESRPNEAERDAIKKVLHFAKEACEPIYIVHVSTREGIEVINQAKELGQKVYGETCPHYLLLTDDCYKKAEPQKYIMTPPLRKKVDQEMLWKSISDGTLQCITTDHCSFSIKDKLSTNNCFKVIPGIGGSETLIPLLYSEGVNKSKITLEQFVRLTSTNPAKMFGLYPQKGVISVGSDGDITIIDPQKEVILKGSQLHSAAKYSVFEGIKVKGYPVITICRGTVICRDNNLMVSKPEGKFIKAENINYIY